ncbi:MAG: cupredoxin domain-containing protein [Acidimicrobiales bacterium]|nr:cupredoxin domain-containing protein [Acidimicrobiales bacterium]
MHARTLIRSAAIVAGLFLVVGLAACGDDDDSAADDPTLTSEPADEAVDDAADDGGGDGASEDAAVEAVDFEFAVNAGSVPAGSDIVFANAGEAPHTITADDDSFDSGTVEGGSQATVTMPGEAGSYEFHCDIHPNMQGTLTVEG